MRAVPAKVNWKLMLSSITEAREELQKLEKVIAKGGKEGRNLGVVAVSLGHAYHHLNFAWRARHLSMARYRAITDSVFNRLGEFPNDVWLPSLSRPMRRRSKAKQRSRG
jgi:hypothetical protein